MSCFSFYARVGHLSSYMIYIYTWYICFSFQFGTKTSAYTVVEIHFYIALARKPLYYILNIIIPTIVLVILSTLTFVVPADSGERLSLGVSVLLAFTVFMLILQEITPQTSDHPPLLGEHAWFVWLEVQSTQHSCNGCCYVVLILTSWTRQYMIKYPYNLSGSIHLLHIHKILTTTNAVLLNPTKSSIKYKQSIICYTYAYLLSFAKKMNNNDDVIK